MRSLKFFIVALLLTIISLTIAHAEHKDEWFIAEIFPDFQERCMSAPTTDGVWFAADDLIYWKSFDSEKMLLLGRYPEVEHIVAIGNELLLQTKTSLIQIDRTGKEIKRLPLQANTFSIGQVETWDGDILLLYGGNGNSGEALAPSNQSLLMRLDGQTGAVQSEMRIDFSCLSMSVDDSGQVFLLAEDDYSGKQYILSIDLNSGSIIKRNPLSQHCQSISASSTGGEIYFWDSRFAGWGCLSYMDMEMGGIRNTSVLSSQNITKLRRVGNMFYGENYYDKTLLEIQIPELESMSQSLYMVNIEEGRSALDAAVSLFQVHHPEVGIEKLVMSSEQIVTSLMADDDQIDLLFFSTGRSPTMESLAETGCLLDLGTVPDLEAAYQHWIQMPRLLNYKERWLAVPTYVYPQAWMVNRALANDLAIEIPEGSWSWEQFLTIAQEVHEKSRGEAFTLLEYAPMPCLETLITANCIDFEQKSAKFHHEDTRRLLEIWLECLDRGYIKKTQDDSFIGFEGEEVPYPNALFLSLYYYTNKSGDALIVPPPTIGSIVGNPSDCEFMVINGRSSRIDLAVDFMELYLSEEVQASTVYAFSNVFLQDASRYPAPVFPSGRPDNETIARTASTRNHQLWMELMRNAVRIQWNEATDVHSGAFNELEAGYISIDEYMRRVQPIADMMVSE